MTTETTPSILGREQHRAAKVVGVIYIVAMATSMFAELYLRSPLMARGDAARTAANIMAAETSFRVSAVIHMVTFASDAAIAVALYVILATVNRNLALLAAFWRVVDCAVLSVNLLLDFAVLRLLSSAAFLDAFEKAELQSLARLALSIEAAGFQIGFVFLGLGSTLFAWLWWQSRYIPRLIAGWGMFASLVLAFVTVAIMIFPALGKIGLSYMAPMFFFEVGLGIWLLTKGLREPASVQQ